MAEHTQYVYGIVLATAELPGDLLGVGGHPVRSEPLGDVAALVSDLPDPEAFGLPADIRAHTTVLDTVARTHAVLPMTFATIVPDVETLAETDLAEKQQTYLDGLYRVGGAVQFTVRARYVEETVLAELIHENPEIGRLREVTAAASEDATYFERIRLGELVVQGFESKRPDDAAVIMAVLQPLALDLRPRETGQADDVLEAAVLLRHEDQEAFEDALEELAARTNDRIRYRLVGPQAPYDFVTED